MAKKKKKKIKPFLTLCLISTRWPHNYIGELGHPLGIIRDPKILVQRWGLHNNQGERDIPFLTIKDNLRWLFFFVTFWCGHTQVPEIEIPSTTVTFLSSSPSFLNNWWITNQSGLYIQHFGLWQLVSAYRREQQI